MSGGQLPPGESWSRHDPKAGAENVSAGLGMELAEVQGILQAKSDEHDLLRAAVGVVLDDLGVVQLEETSSLVAHDVGIMVRVG